MRYCTCGHSEAAHCGALVLGTWCIHHACGCQAFTDDPLSAKIDAARAKRRREDRAWKAALKEQR